MTQSQLPRTALASALPILTIINDPQRSALYRFLSREAGVEVVEAEGALHALTRLERMPVAAIICDADAGDMSGQDFRDVIVSEEGLGNVPIYVLPPEGEESRLTTPQVLGEVLEELGLEMERLPVPLQPDVPPHLHGDLLQFSLPEFLNWVAEMRFSGHWLVTVSSAAGSARPMTGHLMMHQGNVRYAECAGQTGKAALFTLLRSIEDNHHALFRFYRSDTPADLQSPDLQATTPRILIELAVQIDHYKVGH